MPDDPTSPAPPFHRIAVLHHPKIAATQTVARNICDWLAERSYEPWMALTWDESLVRAQMPQLDLLIVLGGDGSMLRAARMAAGYDIPNLGLNMGRLGFLAEIDPADWPEKLPRVLSGDYWLEERLMLKASAWRRETWLGDHLALNDVVVSRESLARVVHLRTQIDGNDLTTYIADGLIVSTPTGSTAYALAAGGPILPPDLRNILVIPIAPHLTLDRAIVLSEGSMIRVYVRTDHKAILTVDGQFAVELQDGDRIDASTSEHVSRFIRLGERNYFYHMLLERLAPRHLSDMD